MEGDIQYVARLNIARFEQLLETETDQKERAILLSLLEAEREKLHPAMPPMHLPSM